MTTDHAVASGGENTSSSEIKPTFAQGLILLLIYAIIVVGGQQLSGVDYDTISESAGNAIKGIVIPVGLGILAVLAVGWRWGIHSIWRESPELRVKAPKGLLIAIIALTVLTILMGIGAAPWGDWSAGVVILLLTGTLMVGFGEEIIFRGFLLVGSRERYSEVGAFLLTCLLFGLIHGANALNGQAVGATVRQIISAALSGAVFYLVRRFSGYLIAAMLLHGFMDFSILVEAGPTGVGVDTDWAAYSGLPAMLASILAIITVIIIFRRSRSAETNPRPIPS